MGYPIVVVSSWFTVVGLVKSDGVVLSVVCTVDSVGATVASLGLVANVIIVGIVVVAVVVVVVVVIAGVVVVVVPVVVVPVVVVAVVAVVVVAVAVAVVVGLGVVVFLVGFLVVVLR